MGLATNVAAFGSGRIQDRLLSQLILPMRHCRWYAVTAALGRAPEDTTPLPWRTGRSFFVPDPNTEWLSRYGVALDDSGISRFQLSKMFCNSRVSDITD